jgi:hypothetical protein
MSTVTRSRTAAALMAAAFGAAVALTGSAAPAHAAVTDATCTGSEAAAYTPGLTLATPRPTHVAVHYLFNGCVGTDGSVTTGTADRTVTSILSCDTPETSGPGSMTIFWNNGKTSGFTFNRVVSHLAGQTVVTFTGQISAGEFAGDSATQVSAVPSQSVQD